MSKMDALRAMREARYEQAAARAANPTAPARTTEDGKDANRTAAGLAGAAPRSAEEEPALCGHRAISGRTCTRELGHAAKSHRYS